MPDDALARAIKPITEHVHGEHGPYLLNGCDTCLRALRAYGDERERIERETWLRLMPDIAEAIRAGRYPTRSSLELTDEEWDRKFR